MDTPETLAADLLKAAATATVEVRAVVAKGALNIKNDARRNHLTSAPIHHANAAQTINYETTVKRAAIVGEIGYDLAVAKAANIAFITEYGTKKNAPQRNLGRALDDEEDKFIQAMGNVGTAGLSRGFWRGR